MELALIDRTINLAKNKLAQHKQMGTQSSLSLLQVAELMDQITFGPSPLQLQKTSVLMNFQLN